MVRIILRCYPCIHSFIRGCEIVFVSSNRLIVFCVIIGFQTAIFNLEKISAGQELRDKPLEEG